MLAEPVEFIKGAVTFSDDAPEKVPLVGQIFTRENAEAYLRDTIRRGNSVDLESPSEHRGVTLRDQAKGLS